MELRTPRDRDGSFEPQLVKKNQTRSKRKANAVCNTCSLQTKLELLLN
ncbi:hypothetical protein GNY61_23405 [Escherichia coli]|nr:hypothetical protein [Escherichia coli]